MFKSFCRRLSLFFFLGFSHSEPEAGEFCIICEYVMSELDKLLVEPNTEVRKECVFYKYVSLPSQECRVGVCSPSMLKQLQAKPVNTMNI